MNRRDQKRLARKVRWPMIIVCLVFLGMMAVTSVTVNGVRFVVPGWMMNVVGIGIIFVAYAVGWYCGALGYGLWPARIRGKAKKERGKTAVLPVGLKSKKLGQKE